MQDKTILITGGTGFIGSALAKHLLTVSNVKKVISYSRRWDDAERLRDKLNDDRFRIINGDICDWYKLLTALEGVDYVIHAAAYKSVPSAEYNPRECKRVNIDGTENVIHAAMQNGVSRLLFISSDKACSPVNLYGKTKALGESLMINANNLGLTRFSVARYGNVLGSTGSVLPIFDEKLQDGADSLPVTDLGMTRFWFTKSDAVKYVIRCLKEMIGGETFIPKLPASTINDLVTALEHKYYKTIKRDIKGIRPGEKMHEAMISDDESWRTIEKDWTYIIKPFQHDWDGDWNVGGELVKFSRYTSFNAPRMKLQELIEAVK